MKILGKHIGNANPLRLTLIFMLPLAVVLTILLYMTITSEKKRINDEQVSTFKHIARAFFEQVQVTRIWNAQLGGVYVEVPADTELNPLLDDPHRDIVSTKGKRYTKINPAYMTRQLSEIANKRQGYKFRIVSMIPLTPYNVPDEWERQALIDFEKGKSAEASTITKDNGNTIFKYIAPIQMEHPCLKCHDFQDHNIRGIKGGISVIIPMDGFEQMITKKLERTKNSILSIGLMSFIFVALVTFYFSRLLHSEISKNIEQEKLKTLIELAGATAHEMRQPMTVIQNLITISNMKLDNNEPIRHEMEVIREQSERMNAIIKKMLNITDYKTKKYATGSNIVDIDRSSGQT